MKHTLLAMSFLLATGAFADHFWTGKGETSDWTDAGNWINSLTDGNAVFGGAKIGDLPEGVSVATFASKVAIGHGVWIENDEGGNKSTGVLWRLGEDAANDAGISSSWGGNPSLTVGTGKGGQLTVDSGTYYFPREVWMGNGGRDASFTLNGGFFETGAYTCIGYGAHNRTATMTVNGGTYKQNSANFIVAQGNSTDCIGIFNQTGGEVLVTGACLGSENAGVSEINLTGGRFSVSGRIYVGNKGTSTMTVEDGAIVEWGDQLMAGWEPSGVGTIIVNGGQLGKDARLTQIGLKGKGSYEQNGGNLYCSSFRLGTDSTSAIGTANMNGGTMRMTDYLSVVGSGTGTFSLNGGIVTTPYVTTLGTGTGTLILNGGTLKATQDHTEFIPVKDNLTVKVGAGGASFDTAGYAITVPNALANDPDDTNLTGNAPIGKKGLGTLTLSADFDLARTFRFAIDGGIGPIALTGANNTLSEGKRIAVVINPVSVELGTAYTVMTGLGGEVTMEDLALSSSNDKFECSGTIVDGNLIVTLATTAAMTARYVDGEWLFYSGDGNLIDGGKAEDFTTFVFTGIEPEGEIESAIASGHAVALLAKSLNETPVTNTFTLVSSLTTGRIAADADADCAVKIVAKGELTFAPEIFTFANTLIFASEGVGGGGLTIARDLVSTTTGRVVFDAGTINFDSAINQDLEINGKFVRTADWTPNIYFFGTGEIEMLGAKLTIKSFGELKKSGTEFFQGYHGALTIGDKAVLEDLTDLHGEDWKNAWGCPDYFLGQGTLLRMAGGEISRFGYSTNNEQIMNVEVVDGTTSVWNNYESRSGKSGCNVYIFGSITGTGTLCLRCGGRSYRIASDLTEFGGTLIAEGEATTFINGIKNARVIAEAGAGLFKSVTEPVVVANAELTLKGDHGVKGGWSSGDYAIGAGATLKVGESTSVHGITFNEGSTLVLIDAGALSDRKTDYLAFTSATLVTLTREVPTLVGAKCKWGKWRLEQEEVTMTTEPTEEGGEATTTTTYKIWARLHPNGLTVIIR